MIRINTLGGLSVRGNDGTPLPGATAQPRRMAVLALLARAGERGASREKLLSLLWPDAEDDKGPRALAQALYALRRDLGAEEAISGTKDLRLDPAIVSSDVSEFATALARGDDERAVGLYHGPFLDGFHLSGSGEFSRWAERERAAIAADYVRALESLARAARAAGDAPTSVAWWRKLAAIEPLNARVAVGFMDALAAAGDRAGAIQHARVYELLVEQELDLPPDKEVLALADRLRLPGAEATSSASTRTPPSSEEHSPAASADPTPTEPHVDSLSRPSRMRRAWVAASVALVVIATLLGVALAPRMRGRGEVAGGGTAVVAIGNIAAYGTDSAGSNLTAPVADLLTTSLARVRSIRVVSHGRMLELLRSAARGDTSTGAFLDAARQAGATQMIDGTLYTRPGGRLRLDLRRVDLATGAIGDVHTIEGADLFALVDSGTLSLVSALGGSAPAGSVADVTTRSATAFRMYEQGIHAYYLGDVHSAQRFFDGALDEDSTFALAAYYGALSEADLFKYRARMERAKRLATHAPDRERLTILAGWANTVSSPAMGAIAETLATRYPTEVEGHLYSGIARVYDGDFFAALPPLRRVVTMDSAGLRGQRASCSGCDALKWIVSAYVLGDSMPAAEAEIRRWLRLQPHARTPIYSLIQLLAFEQRYREADSIFRAEVSDLPYADLLDLETMARIQAGEYSTADSLIREQLRQPDAHNQATALWNASLSLREQGRLAEAFAAARRRRAPTAELLKIPPGQSPINVMEAQILLEQDNPRAAAILFDSLSRQHTFGDTTSEVARTTVWMLAQTAGARYAAGDTGSLMRLADSVRVLAEQSGYGRDRRLHHYIRGLALAARGDDPGAIRELKAAIYSMPLGYTRTNYELGRAYMRLHQPREAIAYLSPALRGPIEAQNLYVSRIEIHELLARAWEATGRRDSAAAHYGAVARAWSAADPPLKARAERCRVRAAELLR